MMVGKERFITMRGWHWRVPQKVLITLVDKSEGEERKQISESLCILVTLHRPMCGL